MRASGIALAAGSIGWIAFALYYIVSPQPPHNFAGDLGYSIVGIGRIAAQATSWHNVADMIGWETWNDFPSFLYAPGGQYVLAVPLDKLFGDPIRTVKFEQIVTLSLAFFGMANLYAAIFGRTFWRWFAALLYAIVPLSSTLVQWDGDFAWVVALAPWAPLAALALGRRFGAAALPAAGVLCALATFSFSPEQGLTLGLPLLFFTLAVYRRDRIATPWIGVASSLLALAVFPAFVVLQTRYGPHPMWWTSGTLTEFGSDSSGLRSLFGQGILELIGGVYREQLVSGNAYFNASSSLAYAVAGGAGCLFLVAWAFASCGARAVLRRWWPAAAAAAVCVVLACGTRLPVVGPLLWNGAIVHIPLLNALRTPDRFVQIMALLVSLAAAYALQRGFERKRSRRWVALAAAVAVAGYGAFFVREGVLGFADPARLPDYAAINDSVQRIGGRTAVYAFPVGGSPLDFAAYAPNSATAEFTWSVMQRHVDEDGGLALLRRGAVRSVVTSPNWTQPSIEGLPGDMAQPVERSRFSRPVFSGASGARVFRIEGARRMAVASTIVCTYAGPSGFELAAGERFLESAALVHGARAGCARTVLADADPLDAAIPSQAIATWVGGDLFGNLGLPTENRFEINRMQLALPWYRDAYGGDSLLAGNPLVTAASGSSNPAPFTVARAGEYSVYVRASGPAVFRARLASGRVTDASSERARGFRWIELPLGKLAPGPQTMELSILRFVSLGQKVAIDEVAIAPTTIVLPNLPVDAAIVSAREFSPPGGTDLREPLYLFPKMSGSTWSADVPNVQPDAGMQVGIINGQPQILSTRPRARVRFRWDGPTGAYVTSAVAWLAGGGSHDTISSPASSFVSRYDISLSPKPAFGLLNVRRGDPIDVTLTTGGAGADSLTQLVLLGVRAGAERPTEYDDRGETWRFDTDYSLALVEAMHSPQVSVAAGMLRAPAGTVAQIPFQPDVTDGRVTVELQFAGGSGGATLRCGSAYDTVDAGAGAMNPQSTDLSVVRTGNGPCSLRIEWRSGDFQLKFAHIRAVGSTLLGWTAPQYFAAGSYRWHSAGAGRVALSIDGASWTPGRARRLTAGVHRLTLERAPTALPPLEFYRDGAWPLPSAPDASIVERSSTAWSARPAAPATIEIAELNDGNWFARAGGSATAGYECDLVNTCFDVPGSQDVSIGRTISKPLLLGFVITICDVLLAALIVLLAATSRRGARPQRLRAK